MKKIPFSEKTKITIPTNMYVIILFVLFLLFGFTSVFGQSKTTFTTAGTTNFTAPAGVTSLTVQAWGAGGAGGGSSTNKNAGSGGGAYYFSNAMTVIPGNPYLNSVIVGKGGTGSLEGNGTSGSLSKVTFGMSLLANGGMGGTGNNVNTGTAGDGGTAGTFVGGNGANGTQGNNGPGGGGGSSAGTTANGNNGKISVAGVAVTGGGAGGAGGAGGNAGSLGVSPGGGGGGGGDRDGSVSTRGGNGADGQVIVSYFLLINTPNISSCIGTSATVILSGTVTDLPVGTFMVTYDLSSPNASTNNSATMTVNTVGVGSFGTVELNNVGATTITITSISSTIGGVVYKTTYDGTGDANNKATITINPASVGGTAIATASTVCSGSSATINLTGSTGTIQWQESADGTTGWTTVKGGSGETTTSYRTPNLSSRTYYRALVTSGVCTSTISTTALIMVSSIPASPGIITGSATQCSGAITQVYSIAAVPNATTYNWLVPTGWTITAGSGTTSITVTTGMTGQNGNITVSAQNSCGTSTNSTLAVMVGSCINKWRGTTSSSNWDIPGNWTQNFVPAVDASIVFDDAVVNHLVLDQDRSVTNIHNAQATYRVVCNGKKLTLKGNMMFTNGAQIDASANNSTIEFAGNITQSIISGSFFNDQVFNLTVNNSNHVTVNGNLRILNLLNVSVGRLDAFSNSPTIIYGGSSAQTIESNQYLNEKIFNLNIDNANGVTLNTNFVLSNNLTINSAKKFIIDAAKSLTVTVSITNNAGTTGLILKSTAAGTASLIHNTNNVPATVQRYISGAKEAWHFLSAPVSNQTIAGSSFTPSGTYGNGTGYDLYLWNEPTPCWVYHKNDEGGLTFDPKNPKWPAVHSSKNFIPGRGYLYSVQATNPTTEFAGNLNNGSITYSITNSILGEDPNVRGFNLIGNPYPSSIDWLATSGWTRDALLVSGGGGFDMWIWNPVTSNYGVYNSLTSIGTNGVTQNIAPMQGFFVRAATNGTVTMTNSIRGNSGASNWTRMKTTKAEIVKVQIASKEDNGSDEILLQFGAPSNEAGAAKLFSTVTTAPSLFLNHEKKELSVLNLTDIIENSSVPLMFKAGKDGNYALSISSESASYDVLLLEDKKTNTITDLNANATYQFKGSVKDAADRFVLHFVPIIPEVVNLPATIYYDGNEINVDLTLVEGQTDIKVYDMLGRLLVDKKVEGKMIHSFAIKVKNGVYIVLASSKGKSISRKVLVY